MKDFSQLESIVDYTFNNKDLLKEALTHRSYLNENTSWHLPHNERLEFLGDAVLELAISQHLYLSHTECAEGQLTSYRAALVNSHMLSRVAKEIGLEEFLLLSRGEAQDTGRARDALLANATEALIGAIYLDADYKVAAKFVRKFISIHINEVIEKKSWKDPKSDLQEHVQDGLGLTPEYKVLDEWGPDHKKVFKVGVYFNDKLIAQGEGYSKQEAEVQAAEKALVKQKSS